MAGDVGPKVFPYISAGILILCGIGLCVTGKEASPAYYNKAQFQRLALIFGIVLLYVVGMNFIGYVVSSFAALFILCTLFSKGKGIQLWKRLVFTVLLTGILWFVFTNLFHIPLPKGILF